MALQGQLSLLKSCGFKPRIVYTDPHSTFRSMTQEFPGTENDVGGANDHVAKVDAKIRRIKEMARKVKAGLPWELPGQLFKDLVTYAVSRINLCRTTALSKNVCPRALFTGIPIDYKRELLLAFGDYVEAYKGTTNNMAELSAACIALYPAANSMGSWVLWKIDTWCKVRRSNVVKLVTTDAIITTMNAIAEGDTLQAKNSQGTGLAELLSRQPTEVGASQAEEPRNNPDETQGRNHERSEDENEERNEESRTSAAETERNPQNVTTRPGRLVTRPSRYALVTKVARSAWEEQAAKVAIEKELRQLTEELVAIVPVKRTSIPADVTILKSHMFLVNKYTAGGSFDKVKVRLIADGRDQDAELFPNKSSPTVAIHSVWSTDVYMKLDPKITKMAKELYGCIQAGALWYALVRSVIEGMNYTVSETDKCVFMKQVGERVYLLLLYVDDIPAEVDAEEAARLKVKLEELFGVIQFEEGDKLSFLGMDVTIKNSGTTIDMGFYVDQVLEGEEVEVFESPETKNMFIVDSILKVLLEEVRKVFHSKTAKLLYLAKPARPDILTAVTFLCTRVQAATEEDRSKLYRVLGYLKGTREHTLVLHALGENRMMAYV